MIIEKLELGNVPVAQIIVNQMLKAGAEKHPVLTELRRDVFRGGSVWVMGTGAGDVFSIHCSRIGKRKKNKWEPFMNWWGAYTLPEFRRKGLATLLYQEAERVAVAAGCRRVRSLAGSSAGLGLHLKLKHRCWGLTPTDEVWVDSPLPTHEGEYAWAEQPPQAPGPFMKRADILQQIKTGLRYDHAT